MRMSMLLAMILLTSCTIVPKQPVSTVSSFSGNEQNSGFLGYTEDHYGIITQAKLDEYNALVDVFGSKFYPPVKENDGITRRNGAILIDKEHLVKFSQMLDMARKEVR